MKIIPLLVLVVLVAGCTGAGFDFSDGVSPKTTEKPADIIIIPSESKVAPKAPINFGEQFPIHFAVKNQGTDVEKEYVSNVKAELFDTGLCKVKKSDNTYSVLKADEKLTLLEKQTLAPGATGSVNADLEAPPVGTPAAGEKMECDLKYKVSYSLSSLTDTTVGVISQRRLEQLGGTSKFQPTQNIGIGPVKISFIYPKGAQLSSTKAGSTISVGFFVENKGQGDFTKILANQLKLYVPLEDGNEVLRPHHPASQQAPCDNFEEQGTDETKKNFKIYTNSAPIDLINKKSDPIRCFFTAPNVEDEKTYFLTAKMDYTYTIFDDMKVQINTGG